MKYILLLTLVFAGLMACGTSKSKIPIQKNTSKFSYTYDTIFRTYRGDFTKRYVGGIDLHWKDSTTYIVYNFCGSNQLKIIDFQSDSVLELALFNSGCMQVYSDFKKQDFVVLVPESGKVWRYCDGTTEVEEVCNVFSDSGFKKSGMLPWEYKPGGDQYVRVPENTLYFGLRQDYDNRKGTYSKMNWGCPAHAKLNLETGRVELFGTFSKEAMYSIYGLKSNQYSLYVGDSIITSNAWDGEIQIINTLTNSLTRVLSKSAYDTIPITKFKYKGPQSGKMNEKFKHGLLAPNYESLFYNPYNGNYYRIFHPKMSEFNSEGLSNSEYDKLSVLMVYDKKMNLLDEVLLPVRRSQILKLFPLKDGVAIYLPELFQHNGYKGTESYTIAYLNIHHK